MGQGKVIVPRSGHITVLDQRVMEMTVKALFHFTDILDSSDTADTDLLPFLDIGLRCGHFDSVLVSRLLYEHGIYYGNLYNTPNRTDLESVIKENSLLL